MNILIPDDLDGKIIEEALLESYKVNPPKYRSGKTKTQVKEILSIEDEESMKESLRSLGYLE